MKNISIYIYIHIYICINCDLLIWYNEVDITHLQINLLNWSCNTVYIIIHLNNVNNYYRF